MNAPLFYSSNFSNVVTEMLSSAVDEINNYAASKTALVSDTNYHLYSARQVAQRTLASENAPVLHSALWIPVG